MKFSCDIKDLKQSISMVEKAISSRTALPVLENIYFELVQDNLTLRGNDLEIGIEHSLKILNSESAGTVLVKSRTISNIISKLSSKQVHFSLNDNQQMVINADNVSFNILCQDSKEYPVFPAIESGQKFTLTVAQLKDLIKHTIFSASFDETKQFLNGILVKSEGENLYFITTDGYRLALKKTSGSWPEEKVESIIPFKAMNELNKIIQAFNEDQAVSIVISDSQVSFQTKELLIISRIIKGQFPDYKKVLPAQSEQKVTVSRRHFLDACERASIIAEASNHVIHLYFDNDIEIKASAPSLGVFQERVSFDRIQGQGEVKIAFNVKLILEAVKILSSDDIQIEFNSGLSPCIITEAGNDDFKYIVMPIRTSDFQKEAPASKPSVQKEKEATPEVATPSSTPSTDAQVNESNQSSNNTDDQINNEANNDVTNNEIKQDISEDFSRDNVDTQVDTDVNSEVENKLEEPVPTSTGVSSDTPF